MPHGTLEHQLTLCLMQKTSNILKELLREWECQREGVILVKYSALYIELIDIEVCIIYCPTCVIW